MFKGYPLLRLLRSHLPCLRRGVERFGSVLFWSSPHSSPETGEVPVRAEEWMGVVQGEVTFARLRRSSEPAR